MTDDCGACQPAARADLPEISNRPGLPAILYRIRTYASFRAAMLRAIPRVPVVDDHQRVTFPLRDWTAREDDDFGVALIDLWAYVADVLTFYQERTANEAYLRTARHRDSLRRLAALLDYRPAPGVAATAYLAFLLQAPTPSSPETVIRPGLRVQSVPGQDEKPQKFETTETRTARYAWNKLTPVTTQVQELEIGTDAIYLPGAVRSLKKGDALLIVGDERQRDPVSNRWDLRFVVDSQPLSDADLTRVTLDQGLGAYRGVRATLPAQENPQVYALRRQASLFGYNAPDWKTLPEIVRRQASGQAFDIQTTMKTTGAGSANQTVTTVTTLVPKSPATTLPALPNDWNFAANPSGAKIIDLDSTYPTLLVSDWVVLSSPAYDAELYRVEEVSTESRTDFMITGKVTRLNVDTDVHLSGYKADTRAAVVFFGQELLGFGAIPDGSRFSTDAIEVEGDHTDLERGHPILLVGRAQVEGENEDEDANELAYVNEALLTSRGTTRLTFLDPLAHRYERATLGIYANVVTATHGETVRETVGSGDAALPFQTFELQKAPVTYIPQAGAPNGAASTLEIRVNDVKWEEVRSFYGQDRDESVFTTQTDEDGAVRVRFGDGITGKRLPTGRSNITAVYRQGIGAAGNLPADTIKTLLDRPLGVKSVTNPVPSEGGAEAESLDAIRANAPNTVRTFGRIVSLRDFEDAAREYAGVAKARAALKWDDEGQYIDLSVAGDGGADIEPGGATYSALLADLNARRDPNRRMVLGNHTRIGVTLDAALVIDTPTYLADTVIAAVTAAVEAYFAFDQLDLGRAVYLSDLYRVMHAVDGVVAVDVNDFRRVGAAGRTRVATAVMAASSELITLESLTLSEMQGASQ